MGAVSSEAQYYEKAAKSCLFLAHSPFPTVSNRNTTKLSCDKVHVGLSLDLATYEDLLEQTRCVVVTIGSPPWPLNPLSKEEIVKIQRSLVAAFQLLEVAASTCFYKPGQIDQRLNAENDELALVPGYYEGK